MANEADELEDLEKGSKSHRRKFNNLVKAVRKLQNDAKKNRRSPMVLYLETDSIPLAVEVDATVFEMGATNPFLEDIA